MNNVMKFSFLIIIFIGFMCGIAKAQNFWVKFTDSNNDGSIDFTANAYNCDVSQNYYTGVADINHSTFSSSLLIPAGDSSSVTVSWRVSPGGSLLCDIYLTDGSNWYWTSEGDAIGGSIGDTVFGINWASGNSGIPVYNFNLSLTGDTFAIVSAVPIPSALWLLGPGAVALGLIRKKMLCKLILS